MGISARAPRALGFMYYNLRFFQFSGIFRLPRAQRIFSSQNSLGSPGCLRIPHGAPDLHFLPTFPFP